MKTIKLTYILLFLFSTLFAQQKEFLDAKTCPFILGAPKPVTNAEDNFNRVKVSPDGKKLMVTKQRYQGIYIVDLENNNQVTKVTDEEKVGFDAKWEQKGEVIEFRSNKNNIIGEYLRYDIKNRSIISDNSTFKSASSESQNEISVKYNLLRRMVEATDGNNTWDITSEQGVYYDLIISPDKTKVLIHKNDGKMYIYSLNGSGLLYNLGNGLCQSWIPDSRYIVYFISHDGEYRTAESDIYISSIDGSKQWKLTNTSDKIEKWPHLSEDGTKLSFYEMTTKRIYISDFTKKQ